MWHVFLRRGVFSLQQRAARALLLAERATRAWRRERWREDQGRRRRHRRIEILASVS